MAIEIPLKAKYRAIKPKGRFRADYQGNSGKHQLKSRAALIPGTGARAAKRAASARKR